MAIFRLPAFDRNSARVSAGGRLRPPCCDSNGIGVLVNKNPAPASIALFPNDLIETQKAVVARIEVTGSSADINPETVVQFEGNELVLDHGSLSVNTSRGMASARWLLDHYARKQRRMDSLRCCRRRWESHCISAQE